MMESIWTLSVHREMPRNSPGARGLGGLETKERERRRRLKVLRVMPLVLCRRILRGELIPFRDTSITLHERRHSLQESDEECSSWNRELTVYEVRAWRGCGPYLAKTLSGYPFG